MKIIAVDRYARPWISDEVVVRDGSELHLFDLKMSQKQNLLRDKFNESFFKLVPDNYPLYEANRSRVI